MMKIENCTGARKRYVKPSAKAIVINAQRVLCASTEGLTMSENNYGESYWE